VSALRQATGVQGKPRLLRRVCVYTHTYTHTRCVFAPTICKYKCISREMSVATPWKILKLQSLAGRVSGDGACLSLLKQASCLNFFFFLFPLCRVSHVIRNCHTFERGGRWGGGKAAARGNLKYRHNGVCGKSPK